VGSIERGGEEERKIPILGKVNFTVLDKQDWKTFTIEFCRGIFKSGIVEENDQEESTSPKRERGC